jgi:hypothetical protein
MASSKQAMEEEAAAKLKAEAERGDGQFEADVSQHQRYLIELAGRDLAHSIARAEALLKLLIGREKAKLPAARLEALLTAAEPEQVGALDVDDREIGEQFTHWPDKSFFVINYIDDVIPIAAKFGLTKLLLERYEKETPALAQTAPDREPKSLILKYAEDVASSMVEALAAIHLTHKKQDIRSTYSSLLTTGIPEELAAATGLDARPGIIPKLRASIEAATKRFAETAQTLQRTAGIPQRIVEAAAATKLIGTLGLDEDAAAHYGVLLQGYIVKLNASIEAAVRRFTAINQSTFQTEADRPRRLAAVGTAIAGIGTLAIVDADEAAHYEALLRDFGAKLNASIEVATRKFAEVNEGLKKMAEIPRRLEAAEAAMKGVGTLGLDEDATAHCGSLLQERIIGLRTSIDAAEKLFAEKDYIGRSKKEDPRAIIAEIKIDADAKNISKLAISEEGKMHFYSLLQNCCHQLEDLLGLAHTQFAAFGFSKIVNPFDRLKAMQATRDRLSMGPTIVHQFKAAVVASSIVPHGNGGVDLGQLPEVAPSEEEERRKKAAAALTKL